MPAVPEVSFTFKKRQAVFVFNVYSFFLIVCICQRTNVGLLQEQYTLMTMEPSIQLQWKLFFF